jgi:mono/diheme cytochrome c family protein
MVTFRTMGAMVVLASLLASASHGQPSGDERSITRGHAIVLTNCSMCHAVGRAGDSPNPVAPRFRELSQRYPIENLGEALAEGIIVGHPEMPQLSFSAREVSDIIAYLDSIQVRRNASGRPHRTLG